MATQIQKKLLGYGPDGKAYYNVNGILQDETGKILNPNQVPQNLSQDKAAVTPNPAAPVSTIPGTDIPTNSDRGNIETEAGRETKQIEDASNQAAALGNQSLSGLGDILQKQNQAQFNYDLPGIQENLADSGLFSSPSALASAVARESGMLGANTQAQLAQAGLGNIALQQQGILGANQNALGLQQGGLQRQFSTADYDKQAQLAKDIGALSVPNSPGFSLGGALSGGVTGAAAAAPLWAANPGLGAGITALGALGGGSKGGAGGSCFIISHLFRLKIIKRREAFNVHEKLKECYSRHAAFFHAYYAVAPIFVAKADKQGFDWKSLKPFIVDGILACKNSEEAFSHFYSICKKLFLDEFPELSMTTDRLEKSYGY